MDRYDELIKSLEKYMCVKDELGNSLFAQTAEAIKALQAIVEEKQKSYAGALEDLENGRECKFCAHVDICSTQRIERNLVYGGCSKWQWRGIKTEVKAEDKAS